MTNEVEIFIEEVIAAAKAKNGETLKSLMQTGRSLDMKDNKDFSAAMHLAKEGDKESCIFLASQGAELEDFVCGAAYADKKDLVEFFLREMSKKRLRPDYNRVAAYAAQGGYQAVADYFLSKINKSKRNHNWVAANAAQGGHQEIAEHYLNQIHEGKRDYGWVAASAADSGHHATADYFIKKIVEKYRRLALNQRVNSSANVSNSATSMMSQPPITHTLNDRKRLSASVAFNSASVPSQQQTALVVQENSNLGHGNKRR